MRRGHHDDIGYAAAVSDVKIASVSRAVCANNAGPVNCKGYIEALHGDVVDKLIVGTLQKS